MFVYTCFYYYCLLDCLLDCRLGSGLGGNHGGGWVGGLGGLGKLPTVRQAKGRSQTSQGQSGKQRTVVRQSKDSQASTQLFHRLAPNIRILCTQPFPHTCTQMFYRHAPKNPHTCTQEFPYRCTQNPHTCTQPFPHTCTQNPHTCTEEFPHTCI